MDRLKIGDTVAVRRSSGGSGFAFAPQRMTSWLALIVACAAVWMWPASLAAAGVPRIALTVRVYQTVRLPSALAQQALAEAETVLLAGHVDVQWKQCTGLNSSTTCDAPPGPSELLLAVREGTRCQDRPSTLGRAWVIRRGGGKLATVYVNCVARLATAAGTDVAVLLGRVAAHELGHLMMRTSAHPRRGLMRPHWTPDEVRRNLAADWAFTASDVTGMHQPGTQ